MNNFHLTLFHFLFFISFALCSPSPRHWLHPYTLDQFILIPGIHVSTSCSYVRTCAYLLIIILKYRYFASACMSLFQIRISLNTLMIKAIKNKNKKSLALWMRYMYEWMFIAMPSRVSGMAWHMDDLFHSHVFIAPKWEPVLELANHLSIPIPSWTISI